MKVYCVREKCSNYMTVVFAETPGKAKLNALFTPCCNGADYLDIRVRRLPHMDKYYKPEKLEMDWFNNEDRIALVKECGFRCEDVYLEECKKCPAKDYCDEWEVYESEHEDFNLEDMENGE